MLDGLRETGEGRLDFGGEHYGHRTPSLTCSDERNSPVLKPEPGVASPPAKNARSRNNRRAQSS